MLENKIKINNFLIIYYPTVPNICNLNNKELKTAAAAAAAAAFHRTRKRKSNKKIPILILFIYIC
jgi:hypothetical protein